jgi:hypothetical protein
MIQSHQTTNGKKKNPNSCTTPARIPSRAYQRGRRADLSATAEVAQTTRELTTTAATQAK